jgi:hypothetical protein
MRLVLTPLIALALALAAAPAQAQDEIDRANAPGRGERASEVASVESQTAPNPRFVPEVGLDPSLLPSRDATPSEPALRAEVDDGIEFRLEGALGVSAGHDTNVFRADEDTTDDGFFRTSAEIELLTKFPDGNELFVELSGESLLYFNKTNANEGFVSSFIEYFHPLTSWLEVGVQNAFEYSEINLLDDNGDLFPRGRFGSLDEEARAFAIFRPQTGSGTTLRLRDVAFELGASFRDKDYEENSGVDSLDYREGRFDGSVSYKISRSPRSRVKLKYRFRLRNYREFLARNRDMSPSNTILRLQRHQLNLTWFQQIETRALDAKVILGAGTVYNRDTHQNDRSYREGSVSLRTEIWPVSDWTRVDLSVRAIARNFIVRRPSAGPGHLRHRLVEVGVGVWQRLLRLPKRERTQDWKGVTVALFAKGTASFWRSTDLQEDYDRYVLQGGLEATW